MKRSGATLEGKLKKENLYRKLTKSPTLFFGGLTIIALLYATALGQLEKWGVNQTIVERTYHFKGRELRVIHKDVRFGPDKYWLETDEDYIEQGQLRTDEGHLIHIGSNGYFVEERAAQE